MFMTGGCQRDYDQYYRAFANDSVHRELAGEAALSPIVKLQHDCIAAELAGFFAVPRNVLDFGCGEAGLLVELARSFPSSTFVGFEPGPAAQMAARKASIHGLPNLSVSNYFVSTTKPNYDLIIASHVIEHIVDFCVLESMRHSLADDGIFYVEVPNPLGYETHQRRGFLYYFDRLHVNHFTPQSMARLLARYGWGYVRHFEYSFPYRDGGQYPALGILFRNGGSTVSLESPPLITGINRYIEGQKAKAQELADFLDTLEGVLVWGVGDNFHRSVGNGGPLSNARNMVLLDRTPQQVAIGNRIYETMDPQAGIRKHPWPVVVTVSEGAKTISRAAADMDPDRQIIFV